MTFVTTKVNLTSPLFLNTAANSCLTYARDVFGGREVTVASNITIKPIDPLKQAFYITLLKVVACIVLVPLGLICRLISMSNESVRNAFSYTPPTTYTAPPTDIDPESPPRPPIVTVKTPVAPNMMVESSALVQHIRDKKFNLLAPFTAHEIVVNDKSHLIEIVKGSMYGRCPAIALKILRDEKYLSQIPPEEINDELFLKAFQGQYRDICERLIAIKPTFGLTVRSGRAYLKLLRESMDPEVIKFRDTMLSGSFDSVLPKWVAYHTDQVFVHIMFDFVKDSSVDSGSDEVKDYIKHLRALLPKTRLHALHPQNWQTQREAFLQLFYVLNDARKSELPSIIRGKELLLKQAFLYAEYLFFAAPDPKDELQRLHQGVLNTLDAAYTLDIAYVPAPKTVGRSLMDALHTHLK